MSVWGGLKRSAAVVLAFSLLGTQCLFAYQPEKGFWAERRRATQRGASPLFASLPLGGQPRWSSALAGQFPTLQSGGAGLSHTVARLVPKGFLKDHAALLAALSPAHGTVRKVSLPKNPAPGSPVVLHIQDVHMNQEAQWNIRETVRSLMQSGQVDVVALEGATEDIDLQPFVDYPHRKAVELTADYLLKENKISGPIHAALTAQGKLPRIVGIDDPVHYAANVQAYRDSAPRLEQARREVNLWRVEIEREKKDVFSPALRSFDSQVQSYREGKTSLGTYVETLISPAPKEFVSDSIRSFSTALEMERSFDFKQVEAERAQLIKTLTPKLERQETNTLLAQSMAYRSGQLRYADFYAELKETCRKKGIPLSNFPAMDAYVRYVLLADGIDAEMLLDDLAGLEKDTYERLAKRAEEKNLVARSRQSWLTGKLVDFSLTPSEWKEYNTLPTDENTFDLKSFKSFYREAQSRDGAMAANVFRALQSVPAETVKRGPVILLVTGGYHADGMAQQLTREGVTVVSYVPKIEKVDTLQGSAYLSVFTQEKSPLEKLFSGQKLFLAHDPAAGVEEAAVLATVVDRMDSASGNAELTRYLNRYYKGVKVTFEEPSRMANGGWRAVVHVQAGEEERSFSLTTNKNLVIKSFDVIKREERPPYAWWMEGVLTGHVRMGPYAGKISQWTAAILFSSLSFWTPAHFLWFARRNKVENEQELKFLLAWMALNSIRSNVGQERGMILGFLNRIKSEFDRLEFWNGLGLFALAANRRVAKERVTERKAPFKGKPGFKELKMPDKKSMEWILNGGRLIFARLMVVMRDRYLVLRKKEKITGRIKFDIPGGGAAGDVLGISLIDGLCREALEELNVNLKHYVKNSRDVAWNKKKFRIFSIPGPNADPRSRRATTFRRVVLKANTTIPVSTGAEHDGYDWMTLPEILDRFSELNTGPKMGFYLEFLREAYGIEGVRSLIPLNDRLRLKLLTDPALIETDKGWYLFCGQSDRVSVQRMKVLYPYFEVDQAVERRSAESSLLKNWEIPTAVAMESGEGRPEPLFMRKLKMVGDFPIAAKFGEDLFGPSERVPFLEKQKGSLRTCLLASLPKGEAAGSSVRIMVKTETKGETRFGFVPVPHHKDECLGGVGVNNTRKELIDSVASQLRGQLTVDNINESLKVNGPFITHSVEKKDRTEYLTVQDGVLTLRGEDVADRHNGLRWLSYEEMKDQYHAFTLATRMLILKEVIQSEYGFQVRSIKPLAGSQSGPVLQLLIVTDQGNFVFHKAAILNDRPDHAIPVKKKSDGTNGFYVRLGGKNFLLVNDPRDRNYRGSWQLLHDHDSALLERDEISMLRSIAHHIQNADIWAKLLEAQARIAQQKKERPEDFLKPDSSPITEWDYRLQLAFLKMVKTLFPEAHVVGEEDLLNERFLNTLSEEDQLQLRGLLLKNGESVAKGLLFFVDPIDGTRNFTNGGNTFAFTFGVLKNGRPLYAATFLPGSKTKDLYEADAVQRKISKNGEEVSSTLNLPFTSLKVQRGFQARWNQIDSSPFIEVNHSISSIACITAQMAAGEEGAASELVLNEGGVPPWDFFPALIFLLTAGFSITDLKGNGILAVIQEKLRKGMSPKDIRSEFVAARPPSHKVLLGKIQSALLVGERASVSEVRSSPDRGLATSLWMTKLFEVFGSFLGGEEGPKRWGQHYKDNAFWYEGGFAVAVLGMNLLWFQSVWFGVGYGFVFLASHFGAGWLKLATDVKPGFIKPFLMAAIYGGLIALTPFPLMELTGAGLGFPLAGWVLALGLHRHFDRQVNRSILKPIIVGVIFGGFFALTPFPFTDFAQNLLSEAGMSHLVPFLLAMGEFHGRRPPLTGRVMSLPPGWTPSRNGGRQEHAEKLRALLSPGRVVDLSQLPLNANGFNFLKDEKQVFELNFEGFLSLAGDQNEMEAYDRAFDALVSFSKQLVKHHPLFQNVPDASNLPQELLKNALLHGNKMDLSLPVFIRLDSINKKIVVWDLASPQKMEDVRDWFYTHQGANLLDSYGGKHVALSQRACGHFGDLTLFGEWQGPEQIGTRAEYQFKKSGTSMRVKEHEVAAQILATLGEAVPSLGVEDMDGAARLAVKAFSQGEEGTTPASFTRWLQEGQGTNILIVDPLSVNTPEKVADLAKSVRGKPVAIITNAQGLSVPGVDPRWILFRPAVFSLFKNDAGHSLGVWEVSLSELEADFRTMEENGPGLAFYQTEVIYKLDTNGIKNQDVVGAARKAWILDRVFKVVFSVRSIDWKGVIDTLSRIARNA